MHRRKFIKDSAILGAVTVSPSIILANSGMYSDDRYRSVHRILSAGSTFVGTLPILRAFAGDHLDYVSPFVLFDEFGPVQISPNSDPLKVEAHPHAGVIPTTYFASGSGHHKDSLDYDFQINTGEFMMFSSGRGAIHMEESGNELKTNGGNLHGFQIWLNMPSKFKWDDPSTVVFNSDSMPTIVHEDFTAKIVLGGLFGHSSKVQTLSPAFYYHIKLNTDKRLDIPTDPRHNAFVYAVSGDLEIEQQKNLKAHQIALYNRGKSDINLYTKEGAEFFVLGGQPLNEIVYSYGPFVMNTEEEIRQCIYNYNSGKMGNPDIVNQ
ncbi:MAG: pirin-like C-terminal cupin domain-containing protein [Saprospiraceae bacterium]|nr:pirin-like C-terminal cupin domain-containing protein [Saprospiraceae bacterium]